MPTTVTKTVKSAGGDYTTLAAALTGEARNLVTADQICRIEVYSMLDTSTPAFAGFTTDATRYIQIVAPVTERHDGKRNTSKYRLHCDTGFSNGVIQFTGIKVMIQGLQIKHTNVSSGRGTQIGTGATLHLIDTLIYDCPGGGICYNGNCTIIANNVIVMGCSGDAYETGGQDGARTFYNCAAVGNGGKGFVTDTQFGRGWVATNCYSGGNTGVDWDNALGATITTCRSEDGTGGTTAVAYSTSAGGFFTNVTAGTQDLRIASGSSLKDVGTDLHANGSWVHPDGAVDIIAVARPNGASQWDIGPFEFAAPPPQELAPTSDISAGNWTPSTGSTLFGTIDELTLSDTDYDQSGLSPVSADVMEVKFQAGGDPGVSNDGADHHIKYRLGKDSTGGDQIDMTVKLYQGATLIHTWTHTAVDALTTFDQTLSDAEANSITDYSDLRLRFSAIKV